MRKATIFVLALLSAISFVALQAAAECGGFTGLKAGSHIQRQSFGKFAFAGASLLTVSDDIDPITGLWKIEFIAQNSAPIPDGTVIDKGFSEWHSDKTEILNSGMRPPVTQSFCLGVWEKVGPRHYKLNHFAISYDTNNNLVGPSNIREEVILSPKGDTYAGKFSVDQYDNANNVIFHAEGNVVGTRMTVNTPGTAVF